MKIALLFVFGLAYSQARSTTRRPHHYTQGMTTTAKTHHGHHHMHTAHTTGHHHTGTHPTQDLPERENLSFIYEPFTQQLIVNIYKDKTCYIVSLTDDEKIQVHTDSGIRAVELRVLNSLDTFTKTTLLRSNLDSHQQTACHKRAVHIYSVV